MVNLWHNNVPLAAGTDRHNQTCGVAMADDLQSESPQRARTLVTVATYNEKENIRPLLEEILTNLEHTDVLVIDDNSPDGTGQIVDEIAQQDKRVHVLHREKKLGLGTATMRALQYAIEHDYDFVLNMDADFSHHPRYLPALVEGMNQYDVMIGSRYVPGGGVVGWGAKRRWMSWAINVYTRVLLGVPARDASGAFRCYRVAKVKEVDFQRIRSKGYSFQEEFLYRCHQVGCRIGETPIVFEDRRVGKSKINKREAVSALWCLLLTAIRG